MTVTLIKSSCSSGELSPSVWGRVNTEKFQAGASVMRNCFVSYRGPGSSRPGLMFALHSLTPASASSTPPKILRFQFNIFQSYILEFGADANGIPYMRVIANGGAVTETAKAVTGATQANPISITSAGHGFANGDWVFGANFKGMTQLNNDSFVVQNATLNTFTLTNRFGVAVNSSNFAAYVSGGTFARIFTNRQVPYALADLPYLKVVQSASVMSLCCVNQQTGAEYPPADLSRLAASNWSFANTSFASSIAAPATCTAAYTGAAGTTTNYSFVVTAIDAVTGQESVASPVGNVAAAGDIAVVQGSITITWAAVAGAAFYNVYQAPPGVGNTPVPIGSSFAFIGSAYGNQFINPNIVPDQVITPPLHQNPFARGQAQSATKTAAGSGYVQATTTATIASATGSGAVLAPVVVGGDVVAIIFTNNGHDYKAGDAIVIADSSGGTGATFTLNVGPQSGTYPAVPGYFQQRRVYASTLNNPDTLFLSQTGAFNNFDSSTPPIDSDAIVMTPWGQQVNGIQWLKPMPGGMLAFTGLDMWQVAGTGGAGSPLTPASESAQPQEASGFSATVEPIRAGYDILSVQNLGYTVRDAQYNFWANIYAGIDLSVLSNHLFETFQIISWAYAKIPWKMIWAVRDDGKLLSFTYDKEEQLAGWARHDTNGLFAGIAVATEPPVDAPYFVVKRFIPGFNQWAYYIERMDNRFWEGPEDPWCVDAGLALFQPAPNATLSAAAASGPGTITGGFVATGGQNYTNPSGQIVDPTGKGSGSQITFTQAGGVVNGFTIVSQGQNYSPGTYVVISDPKGAGATFVPAISQNVIFNASAAVFSGNAPGDVIRIGGGQAVVSQVNTPTQVLAAIRVPIVKTIQNDPNRLPVPAAPGNWTITTPVSVITNLAHLEGMQVTGLADGAVIPLTTVVNGTVTLPAPASKIVIGLPFLSQIQLLHIEEQSKGTVQGKRKVVKGVTVRMEKTRGIQIGANQPVASALDFQQEVAWTDLVDLPEVPSAGIPLAALPMFTGDKWVGVTDDWQSWNGWEASPGMIAAQQSLPLPMNITALIPTFEEGDQDG